MNSYFNTISENRLCFVLNIETRNLFPLVYHPLRNLIVIRNEVLYV